MARKKIRKHHLLLEIGTEEMPAWMSICLESVRPTDIADTLASWVMRNPEHIAATASSALLVALQEACTGLHN